MRNEMIIHPDEISKRWIDRLADAGVRVLGIHSVGGNDAAKYLDALVSSAEGDEYRALIDYARKRGLEVEYELHAAGYLMPRALFATNPEFFRMNEAGERIADFNFCVSNGEALKLVSKRAALLANALYGSCDNFYFWMDDGRNTRCHCEKCAPLSQSDQQLTALNAMLKEIKKTRKNAKMAYLAYCDTVVLPEKVAAEEGIFLEYAPFEKYVAKGEGAEARIANERAMLLPLMEFFGKADAKVLEYWYDNSLFSGWQKPPKAFALDREAMERDVEEYKRLGFGSIATFACYLGDDYEALHGEVDIVPFAQVSCLKDL